MVSHWYQVKVKSQLNKYTERYYSRNIIFKQMLQEEDNFKVIQELVIVLATLQLLQAVVVVEVNLL
jgi:hypothetical protein